MKTAASDQLLKFIKERHAVYMRRAEGRPRPWTKDEILLDYKFTNVYRELDKTTIWIRENWRDPHAADDDVWFAMAVARLLNRPSSMESLGYPVPWKPEKFIRLVHGLKERHMPAFSAAYMISTHGHKADKAEFIAGRILTPLWQNRRKLCPVEGDSLGSFYERLNSCFGMGSFIAAQVIADAKHVGVLRQADDWLTWAASGPGSRRGLNRVYGRPFKQHWKEGDWFSALNELRVGAVDPFIAKIGYPKIDAQNLQNCLCEFDKYSRIRLQEGRMRCKYNGRAE